MGLRRFFDRLTISDRVTLQDAAADPTADGVIRRNGTDVKVQTGGNVKNLNDVGSGGGGGVSTKATATGQEGLYTFEAPTGGDHVFAGTDAAFAERRTQTFAADGVRGVEDRTSVGGGLANTLAPNETDYVYLWQRDLSTVTGGAASPSSLLNGMTWDGDRFILTASNDQYLYELGPDLTVSGGASSPANDPAGIAWDGQNFVLSERSPEYLYKLDSNLAVTGGAAAPALNPEKIAWNGDNFIVHLTAAEYIYELDSGLAVTGGTARPHPQFDCVSWDGSRFIVGDASIGTGYFYEYNRDLEVVGGAAAGQFTLSALAWDGGKFVVPSSFADYLYEYSGSFDFTAGIIS